MAMRVTPHGARVLNCGPSATLLTLTTKLTTWMCRRSGRKSLACPMGFLVVPLTARAAGTSSRSPIQIVRSSL